jgi:GlpG protein
MRQIGTIDTESQARVFRSYLLTLGIHSDVEQTRDKRWAVWVHEETRLDEGRRELEQFLVDPKDSRYQQAVVVGQEIEKQVERENKQFKQRHVDLRTHWHLSQMVGGPLTIILMMISVAVTIFLYVPGTGEFVRYWLSITAVQTQGNYVVFHPQPLHDVIRGQIWRLITPIFLHFDILHILFNMMWLKMLGGVVEGAEGTRRLAMHVVLYAIAGNVLQSFMSGPTFGGMSGVNYGLFAYVWLVGKYSHEPRYHIDPITVGFMMFWFFACLFGIIEYVANGAHAGGLVLGVIWAMIKVRRVPFTDVRF